MLASAQVLSFLLIKIPVYPPVSCQAAGEELYHFIITSEEESEH